MPLDFKQIQRSQLSTVFVPRLDVRTARNRVGALFRARMGTPTGSQTRAERVSGHNCSGCGTIFKITPQGALTTLHNFCTQTKCGDGFAANGALVQGTDGNFYGVTSRGGTGGNEGCGTVYKLLVGLGPFRERGSPEPLTGFPEFQYTPAIAA